LKNSGSLTQISELSQTWWEQVEISHGTHMYKFQQRLKNFKLQLKEWNKNVFGNIFQAKKELEQHLEELQQEFILQGCIEASTREEEKLQLQLEERQKQEEILWRQKSRVQWLKEGERNTKFFHRSMVHRRYINRITKLEDAQGNQILDHAGIESELISYYKDLLSEPIMDRTQAINKITQHIPSLIMLEHNTH
jgi:hypothetical protein